MGAFKSNFTRIDMKFTHEWKDGSNPSLFNRGFFNPFKIVIHVKDFCNQRMIQYHSKFSWMVCAPF